ncbi:hypothetical protein M5X00_17615 [Paenibacillus alvei]|uniref:hypothetical protein n=1 Tax=Paenibacillus alvei TaxID=44250 RepID=UPI000289B827|nr:hypothetical protein [Paenibacillus alvei]EJW19921.1 hypothetical protein PAV_1c09090 [Paenibacillus alvei DSM 29]MCY9543258.1 hypothetical protein [Paenibacillus alvei]MCY9708485.1 hypothetical protein [Paenibacillus alvei]MCY9732208.1 hypothetical protein [Paenibacillus alvei]MCY9756058.1 hypothetical protein [Paenibacillus alvei]
MKVSWHKLFSRGYQPNWKRECQKKRELYDDLKEQYFSTIARNEELEEREQKLKNLLHQILEYTSKSEAFTDAAYIHFWTRSTFKELYGEVEI